MHVLTTTPRVTDLMNLRDTTPRTRALHLAVPGIEGLLVEALSRAVAPAVRVQRRVVVDTPPGRIHVPVVLAASDRRIAVIPDDAAGPSASEDAAVLLVFGVFDAVYRVRRQALLCSVPTAAWEIARREPSLFDAESREALRLCGLPKRLTPRGVSADRRPLGHQATPAVPDVRCMQLKHSTDWADAFERAMRAIEAIRLPLFARTA